MKWRIIDGYVSRLTFWKILCRDDYFQALPIIKNIIFFPIIKYPKKCNSDFCFWFLMLIFRKSFERLSLDDIILHFWIILNFIYWLFTLVLYYQKWFLDRELAYANVLIVVYVLLRLLDSDRKHVYLISWIAAFLYSDISLYMYMYFSVLCTIFFCEINIFNFRFFNLKLWC